ncbi:PREDICTED: probable E3 ubiquitin-protein ligase RHB1A [Nelumbo nucifera]|uniref:RING-type E3 ubiquitin transferase n=1 Tax=Nelumbo nucifera TaxID=4432 RepID=A0A1U8B7V0_NELNU|nr:PREDICTED: probable E3 ubiquitin-protein ligase RHB1A [Nelumbo nucifera]XP_010275666.1 PREDICTED: probable E3 ubiquitin-protein ligase RHB1A [Nelumbo nucifera]
MGGCCCCCSSRRSQLDGTPICYYCPQALEERESLTVHQGATPALSTGVLVNANLQTSSPDTYCPPPAPLPYDVDLGRPETPPSTQESSANKSELQTTNSETVQEMLISSGAETLVACESLKESDCKGETKSLPSSPKESDVELSKLSEAIISATEEEDVCPTCLEEYDEQNPRIITKCEHHFHLACILEWMERSDTCPVCDQEMIFNHTVNA